MKPIVICAAICIAFFLPLKTNAQDAMTKAAAFAQQGKYDDAIHLYSEFLSVHNNNTAARLARGFIYSWKHDFKNALADFNAVLVAEPSSIEAQKGLAYIDLWSGDYKKAISSFNALIEKKPAVKEFYIARGQAQMNTGLLKDARISFEKAKQLNAADKEPEMLLNAVRTKPTILDIDILGGISSTDGESKAGLRFLQLSSQVSRQLQVAAKYDNSLSMDNLGLLIRNKSIPYYAGSALYKWNAKTMTRAEGGLRNISGAKTGELSKESQFSFEQILFFQKNRSAKAGVAIITPDIGNTAYLLFAGYHQPLGKTVTAGINYFYANRNVYNTTENRFLADADFSLPKGKVLNAGFYYGKSNSDISTLSGNIHGGFLKGYFPVSNAIAIHLGVSAENNFVQDLFNTNAGLRFRLEK
ncbi:MAG: tetratricopeptide repeat protein [Bacteroidota bacterium]